MVTAAALQVLGASDERGNKLAETLNVMRARDSYLKENRLHAPRRCCINVGPSQLSCSAVWRIEKFAVISADGASLTSARKMRFGREASGMRHFIPLSLTVHTDFVVLSRAAAQLSCQQCNVTQTLIPDHPFTDLARVLEQKDLIFGSTFMEFMFACFPCHLACTGSRVAGDRQRKKSIARLPSLCT